MKKLYEMPAIELTKFDFVEDILWVSIKDEQSIPIETFKLEADVSAAVVWDNSWNDAMRNLGV